MISIMRKDSILGNRSFGYPEFKPLKGQEFKPTKIKKKKSSTKSSVDSLLDTIFGLDPVTRLPSGDLTIYMSDKTSPEVREFIRSQLLSDNSSKNENISVNGLSDDDIIAFSRNSGESSSSYRDRILELLRSERKTAHGK